MSRAVAGRGTDRGKPPPEHQPDRQIEVAETALAVDRAMPQQRAGLRLVRGLLADGIVATVHSVEVDRDAVVLGLAVARKAEEPASSRQLLPVRKVVAPVWTTLLADGSRHDS